MHVWNVNSHGTRVRADVTMKTSFGFNLNVEHAYFVKGTKESTNRAEISAPSAFNNEDKGHKKNENDQRDREEIIRYKLPRV